jgi:hypothetical protein
MPPKTRSTASRSAAAAPRKPRKVYGIPAPRLFPPPLRPLRRETSRGYDIIDFAKAIGQPLLPWQEWLVIHAFELNRDGTYRFRIVLILVARQNGKSHLMRIVTLWRMLYDADCKLVFGTAQDLAQASNQWKLTLRLVTETPWLRKRLAYERHVNGQEAFGFKNGSEYMVRSANANAGRGFSVDGLILDELRTHTSTEAWSALQPTTMARPNPMTVGVSNAGDLRSVVLNMLRDAALSGRDETIGLFEWSAPDGCELDDLQGWRQANPGMGHTISPQFLATALSASRPDDFRTEYLCQKVDALDSAVDPGAWRACADVAGNGLLGQYRDRIAACADVSIHAPHPVTLTVAAKLPDGRVRIEVAGAWDSTDAARAELPALLDKIKPVETGWFPSGPAAALGAVLRARPGSRELKGAEVTEACQGFADLVLAHAVLHNDDPHLNPQVSGAQKLYSGDGWRFVRRGGTGHVQAAYAAAGVVQVAVTMAEPQRPRIRVLSA